MKRGLPCLLAALMTATAGGAWSQVPAADLDPILAGRALYRGETPFAGVAWLEGVALPGAACSSCHGHRGEARKEGGVTVPPIQWQALMQATANHAAYDGADHVLRAIVSGIGRDAQGLRSPMPRFELTQGEQRALLAYLRVLATEAESVPGVYPRRVVVASVLPLSGPQSSAGHIIRSALAARFDAINAAGGVFGRQIELRVIDGGPDTMSASLVVRSLLEQQSAGIFALVGSMLPEPDAALLNALEAHDMPMVATLGMPLADSAVPQLTYLLPSIVTQIRQLAAELAGACGGDDSPAVLLHAPGRAISRMLGTGAPGLRLIAIADASQVDALWREGAPPRVLAVLNTELVSRVRERMNTVQAPGCLGTLAAVSGLPPAGAPTQIDEVVALPMPPLADRGTQAPGGRLWTLLADTAARAFEEALARTGRQLDRARFGQSLDTLQRFQSTPGVSLTFAPPKRHGFDVTYLWTENRHAARSH